MIHMSTTTDTNTTARLDRMAGQFARAKYTYETTRLGSTRGDNAEKVMERLVDQAERMGCLDRFVKMVNG